MSTPKRLSDTITIEKQVILGTGENIDAQPIITAIIEILEKDLPIKLSKIDGFSRIDSDPSIRGWFDTETRMDRTVEKPRRRTFQTYHLVISVQYEYFESEKQMREREAREAAYKRLREKQEAEEKANILAHQKRQLAQAIKENPKMAESILAAIKVETSAEKTRKAKKK